MKYSHLKLTTLAAAVALVTGAASAQQDTQSEGVIVPPRIETTDPGLQSPGLPDDARQEDSIARGAQGAGDPQIAAPDPEDALPDGPDPETLAEGPEDVADEADAEPSDRLSERAARADADDESADDVSESQGNAEALDEIAAEHEDLGSFVEAVKAAGLAGSLTGDTAYTVFAPNDQAFESSDEDWSAPENRERLVQILRAHIVADEVDAEAAGNLGAAQTIDGGTVELTTEQDQLMVGGAHVVESDIKSGNLTIHVIDQMLTGSTQVAAQDDAADDDSRLR